MKKYTITVNGTPYDVAVEENGSSSEQNAPVSSAATVVAAPAPTASPAQSAGSIKVESPMPGTILDVKVGAGDEVKTGQVLYVLEAMKMENDIVAPVDGKVASISAKKGDSVEAGTLLCSLN